MAVPQPARQGTPASQLWCLTRAGRAAVPEAHQEHRFNHVINCQQRFGAGLVLEVQPCSHLLVYGRQRIDEADLQSGYQETQRLGEGGKVGSLGQAEACVVARAHLLPQVLLALVVGRHTGYLQACRQWPPAPPPQRISTHTSLGHASKGCNGTAALPSRCPLLPGSSPRTFQLVQVAVGGDVGVVAGVCGRWGRREGEQAPYRQMATSRAPHRHMQEQQSAGAHGK